MLKRSVKRVLQSAIAAIGPQNLHNPFRRQLVVLTYHRVLPDGHPARELEQPGMYVSPQTFEMHMQSVKARFNLMHLTDWLDAAGTGRVPPRAAAVTFDDGWLDNYEYAYPILKRLGIPATVFVVSDLVGTHYSFWPNRLGRLLAGVSGAGRDRLASTRLYHRLSQTDPRFGGLSGRELNQVMIDRAIGVCKTIPEAEAVSLIDEAEAAIGIDRQNPAPDLMSWAQINEMVRESGVIQIGSHTRRHRRLMDDLSPEVLEDEIVNSKQAIEEKVDRPVDLFCYPNGDSSPAARELVRRHYRAACSTVRGWNTAVSDPYWLRRVGLHEDIAATRSAFLARLSGYL